MFHHLDHLLLATMNDMHAVQWGESGCEWAAGLVCGPQVVLGGTEQAVWSEHWEANVVGTILTNSTGSNNASSLPTPTSTSTPSPSAVKAVVASFARQFGTPMGRSLQQWCIENGWALIWDACYRSVMKNDTAPKACLMSSSSINSTSNTGVVVASRMLDLAVLHHTTAGANLSLPSVNDSQPSGATGVTVCSDKNNSGFGAAPMSQAQAWHEVDVSLGTRDFEEKPFWQSLWCGLQAGVPRAFVNPIALYQCADLGGCIGVQAGLSPAPPPLPTARSATTQQDRSCVCYV